MESLEKLTVVPKYWPHTIQIIFIFNLVSVSCPMISKVIDFFLSSSIFIDVLIPSQSVILTWYYPYVILTLLSTNTIAVDNMIIHEN